MIYTVHYLAKCKRQKQIHSYLKSHPGATESDILLNVYGCDRKRGDNNKAGADAVRRALHNGFITRRKLNGKGSFRYFAMIVHPGTTY